METERDNAAQRRSDRTTSRAAPQYGAAIVGNRLASVRGDSGHHRQAQRGRHGHRTALACEPAAPPGLQGQASLIGKWANLTFLVASPVRAAHLPAAILKGSNANALPTPSARTTLFCTQHSAVDPRPAAATWIRPATGTIAPHGCLFRARPQHFFPHKPRLSA